GPPGGLVLVGGQQSAPRREQRRGEHDRERTDEGGHRSGIAALESDKYSRPDLRAGLVLTVPASCAGQRLDRALAELLPEHSRNRLKGWIEAGRVTVDGASVPPRHRLAGGERVDVGAAGDEEPLADAPQPIELAIVHEDPAV